MLRLAMLSVHGCPVSRLGERDTGGMNVYLLQLAKQLGELGYKVDVFTRFHDPDDPQVMEVGENARVIHLKAGPYFETKESLHQYIPHFLESLFEFQRSEGAVYDLIHSHYWLSGRAGTSLALEWDVPHVTTFHTLARTKLQARAGEQESKRRIAAEHRIAASVDAMIVSTHQEREDLCRLYDVDMAKVRVTPPGVDLDLFQPLDKVEARQSLGLNGEKVVLSVGRVEPLKGLDILIGAMARLDKIDNARLIIVGGKPGTDHELDRLKSMAAGLGIEDRVAFVGTVDQTELPRYYSAADVFVLPSYYESFGLVALEAMACGAPVVASRVGGPKTFVRSGETGYLVEWHCPDPYVERLDILLANPSLLASMSTAARNMVQTMGWDGVAGELSDLYSSIVRKKQVSHVGV